MMELHVCNRNGDVLRAFALGDNPEVIVGRDADCDVCIGSKAVSREHCAIEAEGDTLTIRDLGSTGGTKLNGEPISSRIPLRDGMEFEIGPAVLKFYATSV